MPPDFGTTRSRVSFFNFDTHIRFLNWWRCPFLHVVPLELFALRAQPITDIRLQATGPFDRPAYEDPCHITWCMTVQVYRDSAPASAGADAQKKKKEEEGRRRRRRRKKKKKKKKKKKEEGRRKKEEGRRKKKKKEEEEEGRRKKKKEEEEGRRRRKKKKEEEEGRRRRKKKEEEGRRKKEEGRR
ncbi:unnamed protein product [Heligmosomoides polygyrus]|uniref:Octapeptide-repeat protein T2 n=1 Tax=Heligmosomoides polygyrus TaxID=6339 RepID=A0A183GT61_HELPZ|nr:unnamed protein product [Heligmosomoides polygyrus]